MNNKGFAITTILYGILILFMMLLVSMLGMLSSYKDRLSILIENTNGTRDIINGEIRCTIEYDLNGGTGEFSSKSDLCGFEMNVEDKVPIKCGYSFLGWSTEKNSTNIVYNPNQKINLYESLTLHAVWEKLEPLNSYKCSNTSAGSQPYDLVYTGQCRMINDGNGNWRMKFLTTGKLTLKEGSTGIDVFLVGGGGGGGNQTGSGGGGGYTKTIKQKILKSGETQITIGQGGGAQSNGYSSYFGDIEVKGGKAGSYGNDGWAPGGAGGSGGGGAQYGGGGTNGGNGGGGSDGGPGGTGQGITTREFGESTGDLYAGGGGAGGYFPSSGASGGSGGGGKGASYDGWGGNGAANTGGGGGGGGWSDWEMSGGPAGSGGSGIVIIRNCRQ